MFEFLLPGDLICLPAAAPAGALAATLTVTGVDTTEVGELFPDGSDAPAAPGALPRALEFAATEREARLLRHLVRLGRQSAFERMASLLLELHDRLARVGLAYDYRYPLPLTQEMLADATGLSVVHVNRTLQTLRREELIETSTGSVRLLQPELLRSLADQPLLKPIEAGTRHVEDG